MGRLARLARHSFLRRWRRAPSTVSRDGWVRRARPGALAGSAVAGGSGFVVVDVETTGLDPAVDRVVEVALVGTDARGGVRWEWSTRVDPDGPVGASDIHGITAADVAGAPRFPDLIPELTARLAGGVVVAHHAAFDVGFLTAEYARAGHVLPELRVVCTYEASTHYLPGLGRRRLADCCAVAGVVLVDAHTAVGDARATAALLAVYLTPRAGSIPRPGDRELLARAAAAAAGPAPDPARPGRVGSGRNSGGSPPVESAVIIGFIGSGNIGSTLARLAVTAGHGVVMSNSRGPETLADLVADLGPQASAGTAAEAAAAGEVVVVTIPLHRYRDVPAGPLAGKVVIDTDNYYPERDGQIPELDAGSTTTSELLAAHLPASRVVKAFNNIYYVDLAGQGQPAGTADRRALPIAGDDPAAKTVVADLIDSFGFDVVDAGPLAEGARFERDEPAYVTRFDASGLRTALAAGRAPAR